MRRMLVDHHCHLDFEAFDADRADVIARARAAGVAAMVSISTRIREHDRLLAMVEPLEGVFCSVGTHPHNADQELDIAAEEIIARADHPKVVAIGEAGLDYYYDKAPRAAQEEGFRRHIEAARRTGLPLVIHSRDADDDMARILEEEMTRGAFKAVLHCFTGGRDLATRAIGIGLYVSFSGVLTFRTSEALRAIAAELPGDRILVETDAPYLAPHPLRGKRNEPAYVRLTAECLAQVRGVGIGEIEQRTTENFLALYSKVAPGSLVEAGGR